MNTGMSKPNTADLLGAFGPMNLTQAQHAVEQADAAAVEARATRDALVRLERERGRTIYAIARELGVSQNAVRRMLGLRKGK